MMQTKPYEFMVKYTPQRDWIAGHGVLIAVAFFLGGLSGGIYLTSLYFNNLLGMLIGWCLALLMGMVDMVHLSKPLKAWRILLKPKSSWISRGFIIIMLFIGLAAVQMALSFWLSGSAAETAFKVLAGLTAFAVAIYSGFVVGSVGAIKLWNSAIVPVLFIITGLAGGLAIIMAISAGWAHPGLIVAQARSGALPSLLPGSNISAIVSMADLLRIVLVAYAFFIMAYLWITTYGSSSARRSVLQMIRGKVAPVFWLGVIFFGILIPVILLFIVNPAANLATVPLIISSACVIIGTISLRYVILKAGMYSPLIPSEL